MKNKSIIAKIKQFNPGRILIAALTAGGLSWGTLFAISPFGPQANVFSEKGRFFLGDFKLIAKVAHGGIHAEGIDAFDICYPALAYLPSKLLAADNLSGALYTGCGWAFFMFAVCMIMRSRRRVVRWPLLALAFAASSSVLYAVEWGNPILYAAGGVALWLAWREDKSPVKRTLAIVALAIAAVLKVAPAIFALDYVIRRKRDWKSLKRFIIIGALLFLLPWIFWGGWEGLCGWFTNAAANAKHYIHKGAWGAVPIGRTIRVLLHQNVSEAWSGIGIERAASVLFGAGALLRSLRSRSECNRMFGLTAAMLLIPGNMHFYTGLYLVPICVLWLCEKSGGGGWKRWLDAGCWFLIFNPLQIPFASGNINHPLANLAFLWLTGKVILHGGKADC